MADEPVQWSRIEPQARDASLAPGLEARIFDPLWMLARQWQFGELTADADLGSAVTAEVTAEVMPLTSYRPGRRGDFPAQPYDPSSTPLEILVQREEVDTAPTALFRARAGLHFARLLDAHGVGHLARGYAAAYPLAPMADVPDSDSRQFLAVLAGRVIDGSRLYGDLARSRPPGGTVPSLPVTPPVDPGDVDAVLATAGEWLQWFESMAVTQRSGGTAWIPDRMEYSFGVEAVTATTGVSLEAEEFTGGRLDWHAFSARGGPGAGVGQPDVVATTVVPSPVTYPGMPAPRMWEFEDARVDFGRVEADPDDLGRMLLTEFALVFGGDWLLVPLEATVGSVVRVVSLAVRDTFGVTVRIGPTSAIEGSLGGWRMFGMSTDDGASTGLADLLLVPPVLPTALEGPVVEEVLLLRDETANLAWAIERSVEGESGRPADRAQAPYERRPHRNGALPRSTDTFAYRLMTEVPEHWLPLLPRRLRPDRPAMILELGAAGAVPPLGRLLRPPTPGPALLICEEEVPREGTRLTRSHQLARWHDGSTFLWSSRRKQVGRGEGSSGLRFDVMEPG